MGVDDPPWRALGSPRSRGVSHPPPLSRPAAGPYRRGGGGGGRYKGHPPGAWRRSARAWAVLATAGLVVVGCVFFLFKEKGRQRAIAAAAAPARPFHPTHTCVWRDDWRALSQACFLSHAHLAFSPRSLSYSTARGPPTPLPASVGRGAAALVRSPGRSTLPTTSTQLGCVAWRQTGACSPYACVWIGGERRRTSARIRGALSLWPPLLSLSALLSLPHSERDAPRDKACHERVWIGSGFCECDGGLVARPVPCGRHGGFTCERECAAAGAAGEGGGGGGTAAAPALGDPAPRLPSNLTCEAGGVTDGVIAADAASQRASLALEAAAAARAAGGLDGAWAPGSAALAAADAAAASLWQAIAAAAAGSWAASTPPGRRVALPEQRTDGRDWVRDGVRLPGADVASAAAALGAFQSSAPPHPPSSFAGRGIVILGGGVTYTVPAWVALHMLRRAGCVLPVEVWFPPSEAPTAGLASALADLGAGVRILPAAPPPSNGGLGPSGGRPLGGGPAGGGDLSGFTMKVAALVLSRFQEVLFLDSDNVPVSDPAALFEAPAFVRTGALLWPDYWASTAAPDLAAILGVPALPKNTFESGQLVFDKARTWAGLMAASYFNIESGLYYELFSGFMGKGDKEGFAHGLAAAGLPYSLAPAPPGAVGRAVTRCSLNQRVCGPGFAGNTMTQHAFPAVEGGEDRQGAAGVVGGAVAAPPTIAFLHANLSPKWNLRLPASPPELARRWVAVQPGGRSFAGLAAEAGLPDLEGEAFAIAARFACAPFVREYANALAAANPAVAPAAVAASASTARSRRGAVPAPPPPPPPRHAPLSVGLPPHTLHPANPGIDFRAAYRWGLDGPFRAWADCTAGDGVVHFINAHVRPVGAWAGRVGAWVVGRERYFVPF